MSLWGRMMQIFGFHRPQRRMSDVALERARRVGAKADTLTEALSIYLERDDPFKAFATDIFERGQEANIHRGPPH